MIFAIALAKAVHIAAILFWAAGLIALPLLLAQHKPGHDQQSYQRVRRFSHYGYTHLLTPAAVIAVAAGTALLFLRGVFVPWMFAKLILVGGLVAIHAWLGTLVVRMGEHVNRRQPSPTWPLILAALMLIGAVLLLVLAKPDWSIAIPEWLATPRGRQLPLDDVPI